MGCYEKEMGGFVQKRKYIARSRVKVWLFLRVKLEKVSKSKMEYKICWVFGGREFCLEGSLGMLMRRKGWGNF